MVTTDDVLTEIEGYPEIANFVAEHELRESLVSMHAITQQVFPEVNIRLEKYIDPEDGQATIFFALTGVQGSAAEVVRRDFDWSRQVVQAIPGDHIWRIGHFHE